MFFQESEAIAREHPDLGEVVQRIDEQISGISSTAPLRPGDFACVFGTEENQVESVFELLAKRGVLVADEMVECERCQNLMPGDAFRQAIEDEDEFECTGCGRVFPTDAEPVLVYRMAAETLSQTKAEAQLHNTGGSFLAASNVSVPLPGTPARTWPNPKEHTTVKAWTLKTKSFCLSTATERQNDGKVEFPMVDGKPTKQMQLMRLVCFMHPKGVDVAKVIEQVYPEDSIEARKDGEVLKGLLKKIRSLISDIRNKKLGPAGINPDILPPLDIETTSATEIALNVAHLHKLDDIGFEDLAWEYADSRQ